MIFLPCPFCGNIPDNYISVTRGMAQDFINVRLICRKCDFEMSEKVQSGLPYNEIAAANNKLSNRWNRRVDDEEEIE